MLLYEFVVLLLLPSLVVAHGGAGTAGNMLPYLHFTAGDNVWFNGWIPKSAGAMAGTCIGFFLLGIIDRWIAVCTAVMGRHWDNSSHISQSYSAIGSRSPSSASSKADAAAEAYLHALPPFIPSHDLPRGIVHAGQSALQFILMLGIMTFNLGFIFSILVGLGVGEMFFGRFIAAAHAS